MPLMCHLYGGITPMNVWDMTYRDFRSMAKFADDWVKAQKQ